MPVDMTKNKKNLYSARPGVYLTSICGEYLLVAAESARASCRYLRKINKTGAFYWKLLVQKVTFDQMIEEALREYRIEDRSGIDAGLQAFLGQLADDGYIIVENSEE